MLLTRKCKSFTLSSTCYCSVKRDHLMLFRAKWLQSKDQLESFEFSQRQASSALHSSSTSAYSVLRRTRKSFNSTLDTFRHFMPAYSLVGTIITLEKWRSIRTHSTQPSLRLTTTRQAMWTLTTSTIRIRTTLRPSKWKLSKQYVSEWLTYDPLSAKTL